MTKKNEYESTHTYAASHNGQRVISNESYLFFLLRWVRFELATCASFIVYISYKFKWMYTILSVFIAAHLLLYWNECILMNDSNYNKYIFNCRHREPSACCCCTLFRFFFHCYSLCHFQWYFVGFILLFTSSSMWVFVSRFSFAPSFHTLVCVSLTFTHRECWTILFFGFCVDSWNVIDVKFICLRFLLRKYTRTIERQNENA